MCASPRSSLVPVQPAAVEGRLHEHALDAGRIGATLRLLEEALSQSDLLPAFESIRQRQSET